MSVYISAPNGRPRPMITCECDACAEVMFVRRPMDKSGEMSRAVGGRLRLTSLDERASRKGLMAAGWEFKDNLTRCRCSKCVIKSKEEPKEVVQQLTKEGLLNAAKAVEEAKTPEMVFAKADAYISKEDAKITKPEIAPLPYQPTREQRREIAAQLDVLYDVERGRYRGKATDKALAAAKNIPEAWVEDVRLMLYGEANNNEASDKRSNTLRELGERVQVLENSLYQQIETLDKLKAELAELRKE